LLKKHPKTVIPGANNRPFGPVISSPVDKEYVAGTFTTDFDIGGFLNGVYYARLQNESVQRCDKKQTVICEIKLLFLFLTI
jgi:hypothetical protein